MIIFLPVFCLWNPSVSAKRENVETLIQTIKKCKSLWWVYFIRCSVLDSMAMKRRIRRTGTVFWLLLCSNRPFFLYSLAALVWGDSKCRYTASVSILWAVSCFHTGYRWLCLCERIRIPHSLLFVSVALFFFACVCFFALFYLVFSLSLLFLAIFHWPSL